jgi:NAD(P) transhydrogenase subunit beta
MTPNLAASLYLISGVLFILALRGLSSPETSRQGNFFGVLGMSLAIAVTFLSLDIFNSLIFMICALAIGGSIGAIIAYRISMTAMPQLVAGFHSLVGLAAVLVAMSAFLKPEAFNQAGYFYIPSSS